MSTLGHPDLFSQRRTGSDRLDETTRRAARAELRQLLIEAIATSTPTDGSEEAENDG